MSANQRRKGSTFEREIASYLADRLGRAVRRKLGQARDGDDDIQVGRFRIECKRRAALSVYPWLEQCAAAARRARHPARDRSRRWPAGRAGAGFVGPFLSLTVRRLLCNTSPWARQMCCSSGGRLYIRERRDPYKAAVNDRADVNEPSPLADKFVQNYVGKAPAANIMRMRQNLGSDPTAQEIVAVAPLSYLRQRAGINSYTGEGTFSQAGYNAELSEIGPKLETMVNKPTAQTLRDLG